MNDVKFRATSKKSKSKKRKSKKDIWKPTGKVFTKIGYIWRPTGRTFTIIGNTCPLTRITTTNEVLSRKPIVLESESPKPMVKLVHSRKPRKNKNTKSVSKTKFIKPMSANKQEPIFGLRLLEHMTKDCSQLTNFISKFLGTVKFGNDQVTKIMGYGDYQIGNVTILRVYYVEGLGHNLFSVGQFCDSNLEVAFRQHTCFIRNLADLHGLVRGLPKLKFEKDHLCSACALGKSSKKPHKPKSEDTNQEKLYLLHMDLCGPMRVASVNGKKYILIIVDDYSRFTWVKCLRSKDKAPVFIINFLKMIQVQLKETVRRIRTDNGTEFVNQTLCEYYEKVGISYETSVARSPRKNGVVERRNRTLIEAARTMLIYAKAPLFLWAEAVATACYTQNCSMIRRRHGKTPYELLHDKPPDLSYLHVFGALCYPTNDSENLGKLQPKAGIVHVVFVELAAMASEHSSSGFAILETAEEIEARIVYLEANSLRILDINNCNGLNKGYERCSLDKIHDLKMIVYALMACNSSDSDIKVVAVCLYEFKEGGVEIEKLLCMIDCHPKVGLMLLSLEVLHQIGEDGSEYLHRALKNKRNVDVDDFKEHDWVQGLPC
ncbi:retrovirus-related pol polyprotein from transposon TNT 1-94 [Tanacetum coccineum]